MNKIKVVISGLLFPLTMLGYFWSAFERREDVELFVLGPFSDDYIPWNNGMKLPREYVKQPHYALPLSSARMKLPSNFVQSQVPWKPDLWIQIDASWHLATKPDAGVVALVKTDPHVLDYSVPKSYSDVSFCMQGPYMQAGDIYLPYGYDPIVHYPEVREKKYDACLIGLHYEQRNRLVERLRNRGLSVYYSIGEIQNEYRERYCESKIALSWSSLQDLPARVWEGMAMGLPVVTNRIPDLGRFFTEGRDYLGFNDVDEAEKQVMRLMIDDELQHRMGKSGFDTVVTGRNSWDDRVETILIEAGLI
jgi:spore maturation protein CgeB